MPVAVDYRYSPDLMVKTGDGWPAPPFQHCLMALEDGRITIRDLTILKELAQSQFLTRSQIHYLALSSVGKSVVRRRLEVLENLGMITTIRWDEERAETTPLHRVAYAMALNGARMLQHFFGKTFPWKPGTAQKHLKRILGILAANEFRLQVHAQKPGLIDQWHIFNHPVGPVARFNIGSALVLMESPRDDEDVFQITGNRYIKWAGDSPLIFVMPPDDALATKVYRQLVTDMDPERLMFSTDDRAFNTAVDSEGFVWQWDALGNAEAMALVR